MGPCYSDKDVIFTLEKFNAKYRPMDEFELIKFISSELAKNKIIGWFQEIRIWTRALETGLFWQIR